MTVIRILSDISVMLIMPGVGWRRHSLADEGATRADLMAATRADLMAIGR